MIEDHTLCYGHPWHNLCQKCARNITDKIENVDYSVFDIFSTAPINLKMGICKKYARKLFYKKKGKKK